MNQSDGQKSGSKKWVTRKIFFFAISFFFVSLCLFARPVTDDMAMRVANMWARENEKLVGASGNAIRVDRELDQNGETLWCVVSMSDGCAIIVSPDTRLTPVVSVLDNHTGAIPAGHPLREILRRDLTARCERLSRKCARTNRFARAENQWTRLAKNERTMRPRAAASGGVGSASFTPDIVYALVDGFEKNGRYTIWNQSFLEFRNRYFYDGGWGWNEYGEYVQSGSEEYVFNLYTPQHAMSGCVATAGAALLHYFNVTKAPDIQQRCYIDNEPKVLRTKRIDYDWSILPRSMGGTADEAYSLTTEQIDLLGRVTYDLGVAVFADYRTDGYTYAYVEELVLTLKNHFGFESARCLHPGEGQSFTSEHYERFIYAQLRCGAPVLLGVTNLDENYGHVLLATGYGTSQDGQTSFTRLFLGWGDSGIAWYALPRIDVDEEETYNSVDVIVTMLGPTSETMPVYGCVKDHHGQPIAHATIAIPSVAKTVTSDENGFWATRVDAKQFASVGNQISCTLSSGIVSNREFCVGAVAKERDPEKDIEEALVWRSDEVYLYVDVPYDRVAPLYDALPGEIVFVFDPVVVDDVPEEWTQNFPAFAERFGATFSSATLAMPAANPRYSVRDCFLAGLDPTDEKAEFQVSISMDEENKPVITWSPDLNENGTRSVRAYIIEGKRDIGESAWQEADYDTHTFFRVRVTLPQ